jgi:hypothetical protein
MKYERINKSLTNKLLSIEGYYSSHCAEEIGSILLNNKMEIMEIEQGRVYKKPGRTGLV